MQCAMQASVIKSVTNSWTSYKVSGLSLWKEVKYCTLKNSLHRSSGINVKVFQSLNIKVAATKKRETRYFSSCYLKNKTGKAFCLIGCAMNDNFYRILTIWHYQLHNRSHDEWHEYKRGFFCVNSCNFWGSGISTTVMLW